MMVRTIARALASLVLVGTLAACGGDGPAVSPSLIGFPPASGGTAPAAPTGITPVAGNGQVTLSWTAVAGATSYNVYYSENPGVTRLNATHVINNVPTASQAITGLTNGVTEHFVVTAVNSNGESSVSSEVFATPVAFAQADLAGTWNYTIFATGPEVADGTVPGWARGTLTIDSGGIVSPSSMTYLDSRGITFLPTATGTLVEAVSSTGAVTESGTAVVSVTQPFFNVPGNSAVLSTNKNWIVGITSAGASSRAIRIFQRQVPGVTFGSSDLTNLPFVFHQLNSGANSEWRYGTGATNGLSQVTLSILNGPSGAQTLPLPNFETLAIDPPTGIVSMTSSSINPSFATFQGVMSADKKVIIATQTDRSGALPVYNLQVIQATGRTYTLSDLAGSFGMDELVGSPAPLWRAGTTVIDSSGNGSVSLTDSNGATTSSPVAFSMDTLFNVLMPADPSFNGFLSFNKDLMVSTTTITPASTTTPGAFSLSLRVR